MATSMTDSRALPYVGRFAPSPTGALHIGSLVTALASYLDAQAHQGKWLLRIEDVDTPRNVPRADQHIIDALAKLGFQWSDQIVYQSQRFDAYEAVFLQLKEQGLIYPCTCSRKKILNDQLNAHQRHQTLIYSGFCRDRISSLDQHQAAAWRLKVDQSIVTWQDRYLGDIQESLAQQVGDFVLKRADGIWTYQLAVVVDDAWQGVTHVVRGQDLLDSTARQIFLQRCLSFNTLHYLHVPLVLASDGQKLSKQNGAKPLDLTQPLQCLKEAAQFLGLTELADVDSMQSFWQHAVKAWQTWLAANITK